MEYLEELHQNEPVYDPREEVDEELDNHTAEE